MDVEEEGRKGWEGGRGGEKRENGHLTLRASVSQAADIIACERKAEAGFEGSG